MNKSTTTKDNVMMSLMLVAALTVVGLSSLSSDVDAEAAVKVAATQSAKQS